MIFKNKEHSTAGFFQFKNKTKDKTKNKNKTRYFLIYKLKK